MRYRQGNLITTSERKAGSGIYDLNSQLIYKSDLQWPSVVRNGLTMLLDASNPNSYSGSGSTWADISGNSNNGTLINGPSFSSTNGGLFNFDGSNDYVDCGNILNLTAYTKSIWFRPEDGVGTNFMSGASTHAFWMQQTTNKIAAGHSGDFAIVSYTLPSGNFLNQWSNATVTFNNSTGFALYLNGSLVDSSSTTTAITSNDTKLYLGRYSNNFWFDGDFAQALLYNRALTAAEVMQNFSVTKERFGL